MSAQAPQRPQRLDSLRGCQERPPGGKGSVAAAKDCSHSHSPWAQGKGRGTEAREGSGGEGVLGLPTFTGTAHLTVSMRSHPPGNN